MKQSELRLYCDLLSQQTHEIKSLINSLSKSTQHHASESSTRSSSTAFDKSHAPQREGAASAASDHSLKSGPAQRNNNLADGSSILSSSFKSLNYSTAEEQLTSPSLTATQSNKTGHGDTAGARVCEDEDEFDDAQAISSDMFQKGEKYQIIVDSENIKVSVFKCLYKRNFFLKIINPNTEANKMIFVKLCSC